MPTRRTVLKTIGVGVASSGVVGGATARQANQNEQPFEEQLTKIETATNQFQDMEEALQEGYQIMGPYVPAMGWHFIHPDRAKRAAKNGPTPVQPSALTYNLQGELGSVEYLVPPDRQPDLFNDENADREVKVSEQKGWHPHKEAQHVFSSGNGKHDDERPTRAALLDPANWVELSDHNDMFPDARPNLEAGDILEVDWDNDESAEKRVVDMVTTHPSQNTLHAWVHYENPHGVFAGFNPEFDQFDPPGGGHDHEH